MRNGFLAVAGYRAPFALTLLAVAMFALIGGAGDRARAQSGSSCGPAPLLGPPIQIEQTTAEFEDVREIVVSADVGGVDVTSRSAGPTTVNTTACFSGQRPALEQTRSGGVLRITARCPRPGIVILLGGTSCSRDVSVVAPRDVRVSVELAAGDVSVDRRAGDVGLRTAVGEVSALRSKSRRVVAETAAGDIEIAAKKPPRFVDAQAATGDIDVSVPAGAYAVDARAGVGEVELNGVDHDPAAKRRIVARTQAGDIRVLGRL